MKLLKTVNTEAKAVVIQGLLDAYDIYTYLEYDNDGGAASMKVVLGTTNLGVNIFVVEEDYDEAVELLEAPKSDEQEDGKVL